MQATRSAERAKLSAVSSLHGHRGSNTVQFYDHKLLPAPEGSGKTDKGGVGGMHAQAFGDS